MTLQTLVVLIIGAAYGWRLGSVTLMAYLAEGAIGFPVFAGPVGGLAPFVGPTAGYLSALWWRPLSRVVERARLGPIGAPAVRRDGARTHPYFGRRIWLGWRSA